MIHSVHVLHFFHTLLPLLRLYVCVVAINVDQPWWFGCALAGGLHCLHDVRTPKKYFFRRPVRLLGCLPFHKERHSMLVALTVHMHVHFSCIVFYLFANGWLVLVHELLLCSLVVAHRRFQHHGTLLTSKEEWRLVRLACDHNLWIPTYCDQPPWSIGCIGDRLPPPHLVARYSREPWCTRPRPVQFQCWEVHTGRCTILSQPMVELHFTPIPFVSSLPIARVTQCRNLFLVHLKSGSILFFMKRGEVDSTLPTIRFLECVNMGQQYQDMVFVGKASSDSLLLCCRHCYWREIEPFLKEEIHKDVLENVLLEYL